MGPPMPTRLMAGERRSWLLFGWYSATRPVLKHFVPLLQPTIGVEFGVPRCHESSTPEWVKPPALASKSVTYTLPKWVPGGQLGGGGIGGSHTVRLHPFNVPLDWTDFSRITSVQVPPASSPSNQLSRLPTSGV